MPFAALLARWAEDATCLRRRGAVAQADVLDSAAAELAAEVAAWESEALTLAEAAEESGLTYSALEKAVRQSRVPNAGSKGAPRVRRADLPRKARGPAGSDLADKVLALHGRK